MTQKLNTKLFQLIDKTTNEVIVESINENVIRREWAAMKQDGEDMSNIEAKQTFIAVEEWNNAINKAFDAAKAAK